MKFCLRILPLFLLLSAALTQDFDLFDALDPPPTAKPKQPPTKKPSLQDVPQPKKPDAGDTGDLGFDLGDAVPSVTDPKPKPDKPTIKPPSSGGDGKTFDDKDLFDVSEGDFNPDGGRSGGRALGPQGGADQPQEAGSGPIAGIISAVGVALVGAASSYFAYQKKKLCFKLQGGADPESGKGHQGTHSQPQVFSTLLQSN